jgi:hypothetical protein
MDFSSASGGIYGWNETTEFSGTVEIYGPSRTTDERSSWEPLVYLR